MVRGRKYYTPPSFVLLNKPLQTWQKELLEIIKAEPDDRTIHWFYDKIGGSGKTTLAKHICINYNAIYLSGKAADMKFGVIEMIKKGRPL